jgi:hypothetical protein
MPGRFEIAMIAGTAKIDNWCNRAASTLTITPGTTAPNGRVCYVQDQATRANLLQQTSNTTTSCTLTATSITQNDVFVRKLVSSSGPPGACMTPSSELNSSTFTFRTIGFLPRVRQADLLFQVMKRNAS